MAWINDQIRNNQDAIAEARKDAVYAQLVDGALSKIFDFFGKLANFLMQIGAFIKWLPKDPPDGPTDGSGGAPEAANDNVPQILPKPANYNELQTSSTSVNTTKKHYIPPLGTVLASQNMGIMGGARFLGQDRIQHETRNLPKEEQEAKMKEFNDEFNKAEAQLNQINQDLMIIGGTVALTALTRGAAGKYLTPMLEASTAALMANIGKVTATGGAVGATMIAGVATTPEAKANSLVMVQPDKLPAGVNSRPFAKSVVMLNKGDVSGQNNGHYNPIAVGAGAMQTSQNKQYQQMTQNITNNNQQFHVNITVNSTSVDHRVLAGEIQQVLKNQWGGKATNVSTATTQSSKIQ